MFRPNVKVHLLGLLSLLLLASLYRTSSSYSSTSKTLRKPILITDSDRVQNVLHKPKDNFRRERATFITVCDNHDLLPLLETIKDVEYRFNHRYHYDWVFLTPTLFDSNFRTLTSGIASGNTYYGSISRTEWRFPSTVDPEKSLYMRSVMKDKGVTFSDDLTWRHKVRYWFRYFYKHELLQNYDYYWRVEPGSRLSCDLGYDVFRFMRVAKKSFGFIAAYKEDPEAVGGLWHETLEFIRLHPEMIEVSTATKFLYLDGEESESSGNSFFGNFEIGSFRALRNEKYEAYANFIDEQGGVYYERWNENNLRTIAIILFNPLKELHHFGDIGYDFQGYSVCPLGNDIRIANRCNCDPKKSITWNPRYMMHKWYMDNDIERPNGWMDALNKGLSIYTV